MNRYNFPPEGKEGREGRKEGRKEGEGGKIQVPAGNFEGKKMNK
jgi:hypothetical protein